MRGRSWVRVGAQCAKTLLCRSGECGWCLYLGGLIAVDSGFSGFDLVVKDFPDAVDGGDGFCGCFFDGGDIILDVFGDAGGLAGEFFDFIGDDGKALARFSDAGRFDGGVECQEIGSIGDGADDT